jgi:hypothetical protein
VVSITNRPLYPQEKRPSSAHWIWDWVGPKASMDVSEKRILALPCREWNHGSSFVRSVEYFRYYALKTIFKRYLPKILFRTKLWECFWCSIVIHIYNNKMGVSILSQISKNSHMVGIILKRGVGGRYSSSSIPRYVLLEDGSLYRGNKTGKCLVAM